MHYILLLSVVYISAEYRTNVGHLNLNVKNVGFNLGVENVAALSVNLKHFQGIDKNN